MKVTLKSGNVLEVTRSSFAVSHRLFKTVLRELKSVSLNLGLKEGQPIANIFDLDLNDQILNTLKDGLLSLLTSQEIEEVLWECMPKALYNSKKVTKDLFNDEAACEDFLEICKVVLLENLRPFRKSLESLLPGLPAKNTGTQK